MLHFNVITCWICKVLFTNSHLVSIHVSNYAQSHDMLTMGETKCDGCFLILGDEKALHKSGSI